MKKNICKVVMFITVVCLLTGCGKTVDDDIDISKTSTINLKDLTLELPIAFKKVDEENYELETNDNKNYCSLLLEQGSPYDTIDEMLKITFSGVDNVDYSTKTINGNVWHIGTYSTSNKNKVTRYVIIYNNYEYMVSYEDFGSGTLCEEALNKIVNSLKLK